VSKKMTHREFADNDELFREACNQAGIEVTKRQASKWRSGRGIARSFIWHARKAMEGDNEES